MVLLYSITEMVFHGRIHQAPSVAVLLWDALVMVLLGGVNTMLGPLVGAAAFTWLQDTLARSTEYWRAALGVIIVLLVLLFPRGIVGTSGRWFAAMTARGRAR